MTTMTTKSYLVNYLVVVVVAVVVAVFAAVVAGNLDIVGNVAAAVDKQMYLAHDGMSDWLER
jgi:hypothetical protein